MRATVDFHPCREVKETKDFLLAEVKSSTGDKWKNIDELLCKNVGLDMRKEEWKTQYPQPQPKV